MSTPDLEALKRVAELRDLLSELSCGFALGAVYGSARSPEQALRSDLAALLSELEAVKGERDSWESKALAAASDGSALTEHLLAAEARAEQAERERDELAKQVFVPGVRRCAKCGLRLVSTTLHVSDGAVSANDAPQDCPNGCGPMWPLTEREAGNEVCDRLDAATDRLQAAEAELKRTREVVEAAHLFITEGVRLTPDGLIVREKADRSDPHYRLCTALEAVGLLPSKSRAALQTKGEGDA